jgi:tetratricopeptide (TPR) repeat protein
MINLSRIGACAVNFMFMGITFLLAACSTPQSVPPLAVEQARQTELEAHRAMLNGELSRARELFTQALLLQRSVDNLSGEAMETINLATVLHKLGDDQAAINQLDQILGQGTMAYSREWRTTAAFRKAVILADGSDGKQTGAIESVLQRVESECDQPCVYTSGLFNLRARLALQRGDSSAVLQLTGATLELSGAGKEEIANAHRIAAAAEMAEGHFESALAHFNAALEIDKELGIRSRIAWDLSGASKALEQLGRKTESLDYGHRAAMVLEATRALSIETIKE